jgi:hypothetical protein
MPAMHDEFDEQTTRFCERQVREGCINKENNKNRVNGGWKRIKHNICKDREGCERKQNRIADQREIDGRQQIVRKAFASRR